MNLLEDLGLGSLCEDEDIFINKFLPFVAQEGKPFYGYYGMYIWTNIGYLEPNLHIEKVNGQNNVVGFTSNVSGNSLWELVVSEHGVQDNEDGEDMLSKVVSFTRPDNMNGNLSLYLVNADVAPDFYPGDTYTLQVTGIVNEVKLFETEEKYHEGFNFGKIMGSRVEIKAGCILSLGTSCVITGKITEIFDKFSFDGKGNKITIKCACVETNYGVLEVLFQESVIENDERELLKPGSYIKAAGTMLGDIAIKEYQQGAIFDEEHLIRVVRGCAENKNFKRLTHIFAEDCRYTHLDGSVTEGKQNVLEYFNKSTTAMNNGNTSVEACVGTVEGYLHGAKESDYKEFAVGRKCVALRYDENEEFVSQIFITLNDDKKIQEIKIIHTDRLKCKLNRYEPADLEWSCVPMEHTPASWKNVITECVAKGTFKEMTFYYSVWDECTIECWEKGNLKETSEGRENCFNLLEKSLNNSKHNVIEIAEEEQEDGKTLLKFYIDDMNHELDLVSGVNGKAVLFKYIVK